MSFLQEELRLRAIDCAFKSTNVHVESFVFCENIKSALGDALRKLDNEFCRICQEGGRNWDSGTTALVAMIVDKSLIIANLGDCRGIFCRSIEEESFSNDNDWNSLDQEFETTGQMRDNSPEPRTTRYVWKEVANVHKPSDKVEKARIERANGWVTTETEIPFVQLRRLDLLDEDVLGMFRRCSSDQHDKPGSLVREWKAAPQRILQISRVCGELAVSRALGDRDFKSAFHTKQPLDSNDESSSWDCPLELSYPHDHSRVFHGNLVDNSPDFQQIQIGEEGTSQEFLLLASDGLWVRIMSNIFVLPYSNF